MKYLKMVKKKITSTTEDSASSTPIGVKALSYLNLKKQIKDATAQMNTIRTDIEEFLENNGVEDPNSGHIRCVVEHAGSKVELCHQASVRSSLKEGALEVLKKLPKAQREVYVNTVEIVREDLLLVAIKSGDIDKKILPSLYEDNTSYSFIVKQV